MLDRVLLNGAIRDQNNKFPEQEQNGHYDELIQMNH
jgi:hypothetical protein